MRHGLTRDHATATDSDTLQSARTISPQAKFPKTEV